MLILFSAIYPLYEISIWIIVRFDGDIVREVDRDVPLGIKG